MARIGSRSAGWPYRCTGRITLVRGVIAAFDQVRVNVIAALIRLHRHRRGTALADGQPGGDVSIGWNNDLVAGANLHRAQGKVQGIESIGYTDAMFGITGGCEVCFESLDFRTEDVPAFT